MKVKKIKNQIIDDGMLILKEFESTELHCKKFKIRIEYGYKKSFCIITLEIEDKFHHIAKKRISAEKTEISLMSFSGSTEDFEDYVKLLNFFNDFYFEL